MAGRITRLSIANSFLPLNYGSQLWNWKPCATLVENEDCRLKSVNTNTIQSMSSTDLNQLSGFRPLSLLPSRFVLPHFFPSFCISKVAVRDWYDAQESQMMAFACSVTENGRRSQRTSIGPSESSVTAFLFAIKKNKQDKDKIVPVKGLNSIHGFFHACVT